MGCYKLTKCPGGTGSSTVISTDNSSQGIILDNLLNTVLTDGSTLYAAHVPVINTGVLTYESGCWLVTDPGLNGCPGPTIPSIGLTFVTNTCDECLGSIEPNFIATSCEDSSVKVTFVAGLSYQSTFYAIPPGTLVNFTLGYYYQKEPHCWVLTRANPSDIPTVYLQDPLTPPGPILTGVCQGCDVVPCYELSMCSPGDTGSVLIHVPITNLTVTGVATLEQIVDGSPNQFFSGTVTLTDNQGEQHLYTGCFNISRISCPSHIGVTAVDVIVDAFPSEVLIGAITPGGTHCQCQPPPCWLLTECSDDSPVLTYVVSTDLSELEGKVIKGIVIDGGSPEIVIDPDRCWIVSKLIC